MSKWLNQLGETMFRQKWWVIGGWAVVIMVVGILAANFYKPPSDAISIPGTQAQATLDRFSEIFPDAGKGTGRVVFEASADTTIADHKDSIKKSTEEISKVDGVSQVVDPFMLDAMISEDKTIAYATVSLSEESGSIDKKTIKEIDDIVSNARSSNLSINMGGDIIDKVPGDILGIGEVAGVVVALIVLVITLGSLVAAGLPLVVAIVTVVGGAGGLFSLSQAVDITSTTPVLAVMLGLAVGIDYSLFIVNKYRHYLLIGHSYRAAAAKAVATAGNAVIFAALTVVIALSALSIVNIPFMTSMGLAAAATVALAAVISVTLLPALFGIVSDKIFGKKTRHAIERAQKKGPHDTHRVQHTTVWYKVANAISKHPVVVLVVAVVIVGAMAWPIKSLTLGLPTDEYAQKQSTERKAYDTLKRGFGEGFNAPLLIVAEHVKPVSDHDKKHVRDQLTAAFTERLEKEKQKQQRIFEQRLQSATTPEQMMALQQDAQKAQRQGAVQEQQARAELEKQIEQYTSLYQLNEIAKNLSEREDVDSVTPLLVTDDTTKGVIQLIPTSAPSAETTKQLIRDLRQDSTVQKVAGENTVIGVTGSTALQMDINEKLSQALPLYLLTVVGLSFVLLIVVFRSILIPLKATLGFLLSVAAMFGAMVMVFQWGWFGVSDAPGPIVSFIPIISIGVLFGLAMDYEFFLVSSMHEEYERTKDPKRAVVSGYAIGSRVVVAAAVIMVAVFAGFISNHDTTIQTIGFGLAVGIFVDAFIVRLMIVPAVMTLLGKKAWWMPRWLEKILPRVSLEGNE